MGLIPLAMRSLRRERSAHHHPNVLELSPTKRYHGSKRCSVCGARRKTSFSSTLPAG
ncbi:hypothetical protein JG687_00012984 [Phytophthora cactorum]|uniref:Uncharacterized protein n=1 Tax=Phytophthora cactorum TaxID=29920 RepID=A0A8T1U0J7_9STRA|nr:hypothetical protein JG687_00012984 [Phytophthora cactorum]